MKSKTKSNIISFLRLLPLVACLVAMILYFVFSEKVTVNELLNFAPDNVWLAALFLILLYAFKSLAIFFPLLIVNVLGGYMFSLPIALLVNLIGIVVDIIIPYYIGKISGEKKASTSLDKYPKVRAVIDSHHKNTFLLFFLLRMICFLPGDAISMFSGAAKMPFLKYLTGSVLGMLPGMILATIMGESIIEPSSPTFLISTILTILLSVLSLIAYLIWSRRAVNKEKTKSEFDSD